MAGIGYYAQSRLSQYRTMLSGSSSLRTINKNSKKKKKKRKGYVGAGLRKEGCRGEGDQLGYIASGEHVILGV